MLLVIDVGNTNIVAGVFDGKSLVSHWRFLLTVPKQPMNTAFAKKYV